MRSGFDSRRRVEMMTRSDGVMSASVVFPFGVFMFLSGTVFPVLRAALSTVGARA